MKVEGSKNKGTRTTRSFVGRYLRYPDETGARKAEGGRRLRGDVRNGTSGVPLVSIVTVCLNSQKTIAQTFQSVRDQTYENIEYVVIDGASTDGTVDILAANDNLIDYYVSEPDEGLYHAINKGIGLSQGDHVLILNSDDWFTVDAVETLLRAQDYSGCDFVAALANYVDEQSGTSRILRSMPFDESVFLRMPLRHETMLVPAWLYDTVGPYNTEYRIAADRDMTARLFEAGATFYEVPRALLNFRTTGISNSDTEGLKRERQVLIGREFPFLSLEERALLADPQKADATRFAKVADAHLDKPKLVKSVRALLHDRRKSNGPRWTSDALENIGARDRTRWPKVSVILPFYQAEDTIAQAIDSVLAQSLAEFEIVCVNDCAVDDSQSVIDAYVERDARIRCIRNPRNLGLGASRNAGIRAANGRYIFHLDPDDTIPPDALKALYDAAIQHGSDMTKGAFEDGQSIHQRRKSSTRIKFPCGISDKIVPNTNLLETPRLLGTTAGHWSFLYDAVFARRVPYPTDLEMGQDSIFLVKALVLAQKVTLLPEVVYRYQANPNSTMNRFSARKFFHALEWRRRAWFILRDAQHHTLADWILFGYWSNSFFQALDNTLSPVDLAQFHEKLGSVLIQSRYQDYEGDLPPALTRRFATALKASRAASGGAVKSACEMSSDAQKVATFSTHDTGGEAIGSLHRVEALRRAGLDARLYSVFRSSGHPFVHQLPTLPPALEDSSSLEHAWRKASVVRSDRVSGQHVRDLFTKPGSVVDFDAAASIFKSADVLHLQGVVGLIDLSRMDVFADKPVIWTLPDMNPFTGGCHYSEGCEGYKTDCRECPMLPAGSDLAHRSWVAKRAAYSQIPNLHVVCPSEWLADRVAASSLLSNRPVQVIPNAMPTDRFRPTNKVVARQKLGLPHDRKLIVFGANSPGDKRSGGDILQKAFATLRSRGLARDVEGIFCGQNDLHLGITSHDFGHVDDERRLSLIYSAADVFAFASREDNAPLAVAASLLSGTPVVCFALGDVPELVQHRRTGFIAGIENVRDFVEGLAWALDAGSEHEARLRGLQGCAHARQHIDPQRRLAQYLALYAQVIG